VTLGHELKDKGLARKYARAAYEYTTEEWLNSLNIIQDHLEVDPNLVAELDNVQISFEERQARLDALLPDGVHADVRNFLYVLLREGHLKLLGDVIDDLMRLSARVPEARNARVTSAVPLTSEEKGAFEDRIHKNFGDEVEIKFHVEPSILGGAIVQVGDKVIDGSLEGKLNAMHERLVASR
jgi:F-type H+-transporting ATPase subunit delta